MTATTRSKTEAILGSVLGVLGIGAMMAGYPIYSGYVLWIMWGWFIVPLGIIQISVPWAIGLTGVAAMLQGTSQPTDDDKRIEHAVTILVKPLFVVGFGWIVKQFM